MWLSFNLDGLYMQRAVQMDMASFNIGLFLPSPSRTSEWMLKHVALSLVVSKSSMGYLWWLLVWNVRLVIDSFLERIVFFYIYSVILYD